MIVVKNLHPVSQVCQIKPGQIGTITQAEWCVFNPWLEKVEQDTKPAPAAKKGKARE